MFLSRYANTSVGNTEMQFQFVIVLRIAPYLNCNLSVLGKLDGIAHQIDKDLAQPSGISHNVRRYFWGNLIDKLQFFLMRPQCEGSHRIRYAVLEIEFDRV